jgi:hypothetical protein
MSRYYVEQDVDTRVYRIPEDSSSESSNGGCAEAIVGLFTLFFGFVLLMAFLSAIASMF